MRTGHRPLTAAALLGASLVTVTGGVPATAATTPHEYDADAAVVVTRTQHPAPGVTHRSFRVTTSHGGSDGHVLAVDLRNPKVSLDLVHADRVGQGTTLTDMAGDKGAFAAINADFFNMAYWENHPGVTATESADGPEVTGSELRKGAVPRAQRIGPQITDGATGEEVIGVGADRRGRVGAIQVGGFVRSGLKGLDVPLEGYNQFALPEGGIGLFDEKWGPVRRERAICGSDTDRGAPCSGNVAEVLVRQGKVVSVASLAGAGQLAAGDQVLLGREEGADALLRLVPGDPVNVKLLGTSEDAVPFTWAVGGFPNVADGRLVAGLGTNAASDLAPRAGAGVSADGLTLYLMVVDGRSATSAGLTRVESALTLRSLGAADGVQLDGGGSTEMILRGPGGYQIVNRPSDGTERPVPNGIGVFVTE